MLSVDSALKKAVDTVICSLCYIHPQFFRTLLEWLGIPSTLEMVATNMTLAMAMTDDHKDSTQQQYRQPAGAHSRESMTDDSKEASNAMSESGVAPDLSSMDSSSASSLELSQVCLDEPRLLTLATACQSPQALQMLLSSGLPIILCQGLFEFCTREMIRHNSSVIGSHLDGLTDACKSAGVSSGASGSSSLGTSPPHIHVMDQPIPQGMSGSESPHSGKRVSQRIEK